MAQLEQQMRHRDRDMVPRFLVVAMFGLMAASLGLVAYAQWADVPDSGVLVEAPVVQMREITFEGGARNGAFTVHDASGALLISSADEKAGFIGVMGRVIARDRLVSGITGNPSVQLVRRENGNIALLDDSTGLRVELIGYGQDNVAAFAKLLD